MMLLIISSKPFEDSRTIQNTSSSKSSLVHRHVLRLPQCCDCLSNTVNYTLINDYVERPEPSPGHAHKTERGETMALAQHCFERVEDYVAWMSDPSRVMHVEWRKVRHEKL